jgi:hypothetical protein
VRHELPIRTSSYLPDPKAIRVKFAGAVINRGDSALSCFRDLRSATVTAIPGYATAPIIDELPFFAWAAAINSYECKRML